MSGVTSAVIGAPWTAARCCRREESFRCLTMIRRLKARFERGR
jgi:hypothetical protein